LFEEQPKHVWVELDPPTQSEQLFEHEVTHLVELLHDLHPDAQEKQVLSDVEL
jgi:hypothetical protein